MANARLENDNAIAARRKINQMLDKAEKLISLSGVSPNLIYTPPPVIGGYVQNVNIILNIFNLYHHQIGPKTVYDTIDRAIGIYEDNKTKSIIRTCNPLFWVNLLIKYFTSIPFRILGVFGVDQERIQISTIGKIVKGILYLITLLAAIITLIDYFDLSKLIKELLNQK